MRHLLVVLLCLCSVSCFSQKMKVVKMELADRDLTARTNVKLDKSKKPGALIKVQLPEEGASFENTYLLSDTIDYKEGEYMVYMAEGAKKLKVKFPRCLPIEILFNDYGISSLNGKVTYVLQIIVDKDVQPVSSFVVGASFNVMPLMGPTLSLGFDYKHFNVEAGTSFGLNKSKDIYIYNKGGELVDAYNYSAMRGFLRVGYEITTGRVFSITPQVGGAMNNIKGKRLGDIALPNDKTLDGATAISATLGARLMFAPSGRKKPLRLFVTPEYELAVSKDKNYELLSKYDSKIKSWAEGLNLSLGLLFYF